MAARGARGSSRSAIPEYAPQLATLVDAAPEGDGWLHETKYDGFRMGLRIDGDDVRFLTRNGLDWSARFGPLVHAARTLPVRTALLDGEVAMLLPDGRTRFQGLQKGGGEGTLVFVAFDLLHVDGETLDTAPLEARKERLAALLPKGASPLRYSAHVVGNGADAYADACRTGLEGIVSKQRDAVVSPGRSRTWVKVKCLARQEFVIGGFTEPQGRRQGLGALHIGYHEDGRLVWAGKVGTGFTDTSARELRARLDALVQSACPFDPAPRGAMARAARWVTPVLVAEVAFTEWTDAGRIRHPSFQGLREDKPAALVVRERPGPAPQAGRTATRRGGRS